MREIFQHIFNVPYLQHLNEIEDKIFHEEALIYHFDPKPIFFANLHLKLMFWFFKTPLLFLFWFFSRAHFDKVR